MNKRWLINKTNPEFIHYVAKRASISPILAQVLINRGVKSVSAISDYLHPDLTPLSDPLEIDGISRAAGRIKEAIASGQRIFIHGDYDADGVSATAIIYLALKDLGADCLYYIPERFGQGYGFHPEGVGRAKESGASLIITVDCGITAFEAVAAARASGIDVIITDHHEPARSVSRNELRNDENADAGPGAEILLPAAFAVINPKISNQSTSVESLSGAGVALKLAHALYGDRAPGLLPFFDLAAVGTIADVVPLTGENRAIVSRGLSCITKGERPGIRALIKVAGMEGKAIRAGRLAFSVIPRINAAGRLASSGDVVRLLATESEDEAWQLARWLDGLNTERQRIEETIFEQALEKLRAKDTSSAIVLSGAGWHEGVIGIVASRIAERFSRPAVIFSVGDGVAKGSARSIPSFDICGAFSECAELLISYGGHKQAAGIKLEASKLGAFEKKLHSIFISKGGPLPAAEITIDADIGLADLNLRLIKDLGRLEPFGMGNPEPLFGARMLEVLSPKIVGNNHLRMKLCQRSCRLDTIGFDMGGLIEDLDLHENIDAVFTPSVNEWNGGKYLQLILRDIRPST